MKLSKEDSAVVKECLARLKPIAESEECSVAELLKGLQSDDDEDEESEEDYSDDDNVKMVIAKLKAEQE